MQTRFSDPGRSHFPCPWQKGHVASLTSTCKVCAATTLLSPSKSSVLKNQLYISEPRTSILGFLIFPGSPPLRCCLFSTWQPGVPLCPGYPTTLVSHFLSLYSPSLATPTMLPCSPPSLASPMSSLLFYTALESSRLLWIPSSSYSLQNPFPLSIPRKNRFSGFFPEPTHIQ